MFSWTDVVFALGLISLSIIGAYLKCVPEATVVAVVTGVLGYFTARAIKRSRDARREAGEGAVPERLEHVESSKRIVIEPDGRVIITTEDAADPGPPSPDDHLLENREDDRVDPEGPPTSPPKED